MPKTLNNPIQVLVATAALGIFGDLVLRETPRGLGLSVWAVAVISSALYFRVGGSNGTARQVRLMLCIAILFAALFCWRDAAVLKLLNASIVVVSISLASYAASGQDMRTARVGDYTSSVGRAAASFFALPGYAAPRIRSGARAGHADSRIPLLAVLRGITISFPLLLFFGWLFSSADAVFERLVANIFSFDFKSLATHTATALFSMWMSALTIVISAAGPLKSKKNVVSSSSGIGVIETNIALGATALLFSVFVAVQTQYLFGGVEQIMSNSGLTYAEYARRGFFELSTVAAFTLILILAASRTANDSGDTGRRVFALLALALCLLVLIIIVSAVHRMGLYVDAYGLTRLRVYVTAFIYWIAFVYVWLAYAILRGQLRSFAYGFLLSGYAAAFLLQAASPDALIVRANLARSQEGKAFDATYAASLGADAIPELAEALPYLPPATRMNLIGELGRQHQAIERRTFRGWTWGSSAAIDALEESPLFAPALKQ